MIIRVLIVDDHRMVREGLRVFLGHDPELVIVGEAADGVEAVEEALHLRPDVVLMDLHLPGWMVSAQQGSFAGMLRRQK